MKKRQAHNFKQRTKVNNWKAAGNPPPFTATKKKKKSGTWVGRMGENPTNRNRTPDGALWKVACICENYSTALSSWSTYKYTWKMVGINNSQCESRNTRNAIYESNMLWKVALLNGRVCAIPRFWLLFFHFTLNMLYILSLSLLKTLLLCAACDMREILLDSVKKHGRFESNSSSWQAPSWLRNTYISCL